MSARWEERLRHEAERWVQQGLISARQREQILSLYPAGAVSGRDRAVMIFSILGSLLLGASAILYFAGNWPRIPASVKVGAILLTMLASYGVGFRLRFREAGSPRLGEALIFLGSLLYGAGVWLIAQIYHLETDFPTGFLAWGAGILPVVWATGSRPVLYLATALLTIWTVGAQGRLDEYNYPFPLLMVGAVLPLARRTEGRLAEAAVFVGLLLWHVLNLARLEPPISPLEAGRLALLFGSALFLAGLARLGDDRTYSATGAMLGLIGAYLLTFPAGRLPADSLPPLFAGTLYSVAGHLAVLAGAALAAYRYGRRGGPERRYLLPAALVPLGAALLGEWLPETVRMVAFNLLLFGGAVGLIALGIQRRTALLVNLGLVTFAIHLVTRYFDLFFSAMDRSLFFFLGGCLLLAGGWLLERNRRRWTGEWGGGEHGA